MAGMPPMNSHELSLAQKALHAPQVEVGEKPCMHVPATQASTPLQAKPSSQLPEQASATAQSPSRAQMLPMGQARGANCCAQPVNPPPGLRATQSQWLQSPGEPQIRGLGR